MAAHVILTPQVEINSVDLSDHVRQVTLDYDAETPEKTASGDVGKTRLGGLLDMKFSVEFNQDFDAAKVDATLFPLLGVPTTCKVRSTSAVIGATNPSFEGTFILSKYPILSGKIGDTAITKVDFAGSGVLTRNVTPA
jgi:hypothetical protein